MSGSEPIFIDKENGTQLMRRMKLLVGIAFATITPFLFSEPVYAVGSSGFENASFSAKTLGQANAVVARPQDPSTISFNPAGLVELPGIETNIGLEGLDLRIFHRDQVTGDHNQNNGKLLLIPSFYLTANPGELLDNRFAMGVAVNSPFGLTTSFPSIGMGRYTGYKNYLKMAATTVSGALRLTDKLSIGAGATNYWAYKYGQILNYPNANILGIPGTPDGKAVLETDGFGWGWNLGILARPHPKHRLGFSFRSKADVDVHGHVRIDDLVGGAAQGYDTFPHFQSGAHSQIHLPQNFTFAYAYEPSEKWAAEFDLGLTGWDIFKDQDYEFDRNNATLRGLGTIPRDYHMTWSFNFGGHRQINERFDLLGGFFFYEGAAPKKHFDNFLPDTDRYGWTFGTSYKLSDRATIDLTYLFILYATRHISNPQIPAKGGDNIDGRYTSILHGGFVALRYQLDFPGEKSSSPQKETPPVIDAQKAIVTGR